MRAAPIALAALLPFACAKLSRPLPSPAQLGQQPAPPDVAAAVDPGAAGPAPEVAAAGAPASAGAPATPVLLGQGKGDGLIVSRRQGIELLGADLERVALLSPERGRHLRIAGDQLYFFELRRPVLRALDLNSGQTRVVATLPALQDQCFGSGRPVDPIAYVQGSADVAHADGTLCIDVSDRPGELATQTFNYRVDLATGKSERRLVLFEGGDVCGRNREHEQPRLCSPGEAKLGEERSPSGRWAYFSDRSRGVTIDRAYSLPILGDREGRRNHAIVGRKLRPLRANGERPIGACLVPPEASATWLASSDVLLLEGCRDDRVAVVRTTGRVDYLAVDGYAALPGTKAAAPARTAPASAAPADAAPADAAPADAAPAG